MCDFPVGGRYCVYFLIVGTCHFSMGQRSLSLQNRRTHLLSTLNAIFRLQEQQLVRHVRLRQRLPVCGPAAKARQGAAAVSQLHPGRPAEPGRRLLCASHVQHQDHGLRLLRPERECLGDAHPPGGRLLHLRTGTRCHRALSGGGWRRWRQWAVAAVGDRKSHCTGGRRGSVSARC